MLVTCQKMSVLSVFEMTLHIKTFPTKVMYAFIISAAITLRVFSAAIVRAMHTVSLDTTLEYVTVAGKLIMRPLHLIYLLADVFYLHIKYHVTPNQLVFIGWLYTLATGLNAIQTFLISLAMASDHIVFPLHLSIFSASSTVFWHSIPILCVLQVSCITFLNEDNNIIMPLQCMWYPPVKSGFAVHCHRYSVLSNL